MARSRSEASRNDDQAHLVLWLGGEGLLFRGIRRNFVLCGGNSYVGIEENTHV